MLGFNAFSPPARREAPEAAAVESPFVNWGGSPQAWQDDWQRRYDEEAAKYRPQVVSSPPTQLVPGASGFDAQTAQPWLDQIYWSTLNQKFGDAAQAASQYLTMDDMRKPGGWMSGYGKHSDASHTVGLQRNNPGYQPDFSALKAEYNRMIPLAENYMRQQQAYDWMQGGQQENAVMSGDYANAGFNTITGMSNPYAGPGQIDGVDMDWAKGVYDPQTQRGTGTYTPTHQRTNFGW